MDRIGVVLGGSEGKMGKVLQRLISGSKDIYLLGQVDSSFDLTSAEGGHVSRQIHEC